MKIVLLSRNDLNIYPAMYHLALSLARKGVEVHIMSAREPVKHNYAETGVFFHKINSVTGVAKYFPWFRANGHGIIWDVFKIGPDLIIGHHEYAVLAVNYKFLFPGRVKVAGYFSDYHRNVRYTEVLKKVARYIDIYIDICDVRLGWRQNDWPKMRAECFTVRQAPHRRCDAQHVAHSGAARVVFTSSMYVLGLDQDRLSRFFNHLCQLGISVDWYLPGLEQARIVARSLCSHPLYSVCEAIEKVELLEKLSLYDVGLHWAPMAEADRDPDYFQSAASNKIGEYISAGLLVAHAGNPGLAYLPDDVCVVFDPTDPEQGAEQLAAALCDRETIERKRAAALRYHLEEMNSDKQASRLIDEVMRQERPRDGRDFN